MSQIYRLSIPIKRETRAALDILAAATHSSAGSCAGAFLDEMAPQFQLLADAYRIARTDPTAASMSMLGMVEKSLQGLDQEYQRVNDSLFPTRSKKTATK